MVNLLDRWLLIICKLVKEYLTKTNITNLISLFW